MKISEQCISRPVLSWVMTLVLILLGLVGGSRLSLQQYPTAERPFVTIESTLQGAAPEIVEAQVTLIIEDALAGIEGIESMSSTSSVEESKVSLEFNGSRPIADAINDIHDRLNKAKDRLPKEMTDPILTKTRAEERAIMSLALTSEELDASTLADYALRELQKDLESVSGVARVDVLGAGQYKMRLKLDPVKLAAYNITTQDIMQAIRQQNIEKPAGKLISNDREYLITTIATLETPEEFALLPIAMREKHLVRLQDLGIAEVNADDKRTRTRYNGKTGVSLNIVKQTTANPLQVSRDIKKILPQLEERLPEKMKISLGSDKSEFIEDSLNKVYGTILETVLLVIGVVFVFLRSFRASLIPLVTIPVSLIGTLFLMYLLNFSINTLTLMAMVLAVGLVVDDAIVVLENIYSHIEKGKKPFDAARDGIREISFSVIAMTLTLMAVYAPVALSTGTIGKFFTEFALSLAGAVLISGFAALTLSPMMCARMLRNSDHAPITVQSLSSKETSWDKFKALFWTEEWLNRIEAFYEKQLQGVLMKPWKIIGAGIAFALVGIVCYFGLPNEYFPREDTGSISIDGQAPQGSTLEYTDRYVRQIDEILKNIPEIKRRITQINNPTFDVFIQLHKERERSTDTILELIKDQLRRITGVNVRVTAGGGSEGDRSSEVEFVIKGNTTHRELQSFANIMTNQLHGLKIVEAVLSGAKGETDDYTVSINRNKVSSLNIHPEDIANMIDTLVRGRKESSFKRENKLYDVIVEVMDKGRQTPNDITNLFVKAGDKEGTLIPLSELVTIYSRSSPMEIYRYNRLRATNFTIKLKTGSGLGEGIEKLKELSKKVLPKNIYVEFTGGTKRFLNESQSLYLIFSLALMFIFFIMAAQFESWVDPFVIMLSVPLSLAGAVITLTLIPGGTANIYSKIGFVTLIGLITKHGILIVDVANKQRLLNKKVKEAIVFASKTRLRPILMTTFAMVLGAVPLALSSGAGAESRRQIGWVIVGGMSVGTLFTLFVLPAIYVLLAKFTKRRFHVTEPSQVLVG